MELFSGRKMVVATMHGKEQAIIPALEPLGVNFIVPSGFETDRFGTFTGETERKTDPIDTARMKCLAACSEYNCTLAVASEGSFGPHPSLFFVPADDEIIMLIDLENNLEITARELTTKTNFSGAEVATWEEAMKFAVGAGFPSHGLIVRAEQGDTLQMVKGIRNRDELQLTVQEYLQKNGKAFLETDMRAMYNPTRMGVIGQAAQKLLDTITEICPVCSTPGFAVAELVEGLPCAQCAAPTKSLLALVYKCKKCGYREEHKYPKGKQHEDPMYCDWCNP